MKIRSKLHDMENYSAQSVATPRPYATVGGELDDNMQFCNKSSKRAAEN